MTISFDETHRLAGEKRVADLIAREGALDNPAPRFARGTAGGAKFVAAEAATTKCLYFAAMKKLPVIVLLAASAFAAAPKPNADQLAIESTVLAVYNVISGPAGSRDWDRFEALFAPGARLISTKRKDGVVTANVMTPQDYRTKAGAYFNDHGFVERPLNNRVEIFGDIAHVFSTYESRHASSDEKPFARGINSFQLVRSGDGWKVLTIFWEEEDAAHPIPEQYLPKR